MNFEKIILNKAKNSGKWIVLPEAGKSSEVLKAGLLAVKQKICNVVLIGDEKLNKYQSKNIKVINHKKFDGLKDMQNFLFELRKEKGLTLSEAKKLLADENYFATVFVKMGLADAVVSGKVTESKNVIKPALQIIKAKNKNSIVSSCFLMLSKTQKFVFADCGLVVSPTDDELCEIALASAQSAKTFLNLQPKVALLSYSTLKSGSGESVDKVLSAANKLKTLKPKFKFEGPLQFDAATEKAVALAKAPKSKIAGECNTFVFPSLDAGNIGYKIFKFASGGSAIGPIMQNLDKPVNDLSRSASEKEILLSIAITVLQTY